MKTALLSIAMLGFIATASAQVDTTKSTRQNNATERSKERSKTTQQRKSELTPANRRDTVNRSNKSQQDRNRAAKKVNSDTLNNRRPQE